MIDIHCHLIPGVDDGAKSIDEAIKMAELAVNNGTKTIITTPHFNHPLGFKGPKNISKDLVDLKNELKERKIELEIIEGAEIYCDKRLMAEFDKIKIPTLGHTKYVLLEFDVNSKSHEIEDFAHEFKIRGYNPILAHIEIYGNLTTEDIIKLKKSGYLLQLTAASVVGKRGQRIKNTCKNLIEREIVDFIASDGHGVERRRPILNEARDYINANFEAQANILFEQNQIKLLKNEDIKSKLKEAKSLKANHIRKYGAVVAVLSVFLVSTFFVYGALKEKEEVVSKIAIFKEDKKVEETKKEDSKKESGEVKNQAEKKENNEVKAEVKDNIIEEQNTQKSESTEQKRSQSEIVNEYYSKLKGFEGKYEGKISGAASNLKSAKSIEDQNKRSEVISVHLDKISALEGESDNQVYDVLYDFQTELEKYGYDVSPVKKAREEYQIKKETRREYYRSFVGE